MDARYNTTESNEAERRQGFTQKSVAQNDVFYNNKKIYFVSGTATFFLKIRDFRISNKKRKKISVHQWYQQLVCKE